MITLISECHRCKFVMQGFTLVELLIVVGLTIIISVIGFVNLERYWTKANLESSLNEVVVLIRNTQEKAIFQEDGKQWGVRFTNQGASAQKYEVFAGSVYAPTSVKTTYYLKETLEFSKPSNGRTVDVIFDAISGKPYGKEIISLINKSNNSLVGDVLVDAIGRIFSKVEKSIIGYWHFDEGDGSNVYDASGLGNTGNITGAVWQTGANCKFSSCLYFDGGDDYITIPSNSLFTSGEQGEFTFSMFVKSENYTPKQVIFSRRHPCNNEGHFNIYVQSNRVYFAFYSNLDSLTVAHYSGPVLENGKWYHIVWVKKWGEFGVKFYLNGIEQAVSGDSNKRGTTYSDIPVLIGAQNSGSGCNGPIQDYFNGIIDEIRVYNRLLNAQEILNQYNDIN